MSKVMIIMVTVTAMAILLSWFGIIEAGTSEILQALGFGSAQGFQFSNLVNSIFDSVNGLFALAGATVAIVAGFIVTSSTTEKFKAGVLGLFGGWVIGDLWYLLGAVQQRFTDELVWAANIFEFLIYIMMVVFIVAIVNFWTGSDS